MITRLYKDLAAATTIAVLLSACGGSGSGGGSGDTDKDVTENPSGEITGRAADGYLRNATVCLDTNDNMQCDPDEPSATTGKGGRFELKGVMADDASRHSVIIVANSSTIDEDTGRSIPEEFVLSAPPGKPEFVSPLTTAINGVLKKNTALDVEQAELVIKRSIGATDEVSLFDDYVEKGKSKDSEEYKRLHKIAQVSAKALAKNKSVVDKESKKNAELSAEKPEVLALLAVDKLLDQLDTAASRVDEAGDSFNVENVEVATLTTEEIDEGVQELKKHSGFKKISALAALRAGITWLESDEEEDENSEPVLELEYGTIKLAENKTQLSEVGYEFVENDWKEISIDEDDRRIILTQDGKWLNLQESVSDWALEFHTDGSATISLPEGADEARITAASRDITGEKIKDFLQSEYTRGFAERTPENAVFSSGAVAYRVAFTNTVDAYEIDFWTGEDEACGDGHTEESLKGNCNSVWGYVNGESRPAKTLDELIYPTEEAIDNFTGIGDELIARFIEGGKVKIEDWLDVAGDEAPRVDWARWEYQVVRGKELIVLSDIPSRFTGRLRGDGQAIFYAVHDEWVRRGSLYRKGGDMFGGDIYFNKAAMDDILSYFKAGQ